MKHTITKSFFALSLLFSATMTFAQKPVLHYDFKASKNAVVVNKANKKMNGELKGSARIVKEGKQTLLTLATFPDEAPKYNWLGRAPFNGDAFLAGTLIQDVRVYAKALSGEDVKKLAKKLLK